jgi:hypothetical protein
MARGVVLLDSLHMEACQGHMGFRHGPSLGAVSLIHLSQCPLLMIFQVLRREHLGLLLG